MKKNLFCAVATVLTGSMILTSCGGNSKTADSDSLTDSTEVTTKVQITEVQIGLEQPTIKGSLSKYGSVADTSYTLSLKDSLLTLNVTFAAKGGVKTPSIQSPKVKDGSVYLQFTDSTGKALPDFKMGITPASLDSLNNLLAANKRNTMVIRLEEATPSSAESRASLINEARNVQLAGEVELVTDTKQIDAALDAYQKQAKIYNSMHFTYEDTFSRYPVINKHTQLLIAARDHAKAYQKYMTPEQKARLKKIHNSYTMIYWD